MSYDVVIPLGPNDEDIVPLCIQSVRRYVWDVRRIYVVSHRQIDLSGAIVVNESIFPFTKADIQPYIKKGGVGWYLQQLLKLYSPSVIEGIHENVVLVDADTVFSKRVSFISGKNFLFNTSFHTHKPVCPELVVFDMLHVTGVSADSSVLRKKSFISQSGFLR